MLGNLGLQHSLRKPPRFFWDISPNVTYAINKHHTDLIPCILRTHTIWDVANMRPVIGLQLLMAQGFPADLKLNFDPETDVDHMDPHKFRCLSKFVAETGRTRVDDVDLRSMAGNTMTVQVMGIIQAGVKRCQEVKHRFHADPVCMMLTPSNRIQLSSSSQHSSDIVIMAECIPIQSSLDYDGAIRQLPSIS